MTITTTGGTVLVFVYASLKNVQNQTVYLSLFADGALVSTGSSATVNNARAARWPTLPFDARRLGRHTYALALVDVGWYAVRHAN